MKHVETSVGIDCYIVFVQSFTVSELYKQTPFFLVYLYTSTKISSSFIIFNLVNIRQLTLVQLDRTNCLIGFPNYFWFYKVMICLVSWIVFNHVRLNFFQPLATLELSLLQLIGPFSYEKKDQFILSWLNVILE